MERRLRSLSLKKEKRPTNGSMNTPSLSFSYFSVLGLWDASSYEFGGPWGVFAIMTGFPLLMYYLWICLWFYDGQLVHPSSVDDIQPFLGRMWEHVRKVCSFYSRGIVSQKTDVVPGR